MPRNTTFFDDLEVGDRLAADGYLMTEAEIVEFGGKFDPRPIHTDPTAARQSLFGGLIASGIHTLAAWNRLRFQAEDGLAMLAGLGLDEVRYAAPVRPGDRLSLRAECIEKTPSASKPDRGIMRFRHVLTNQRGEETMSLASIMMVARRPADS
ncbi:MAG: MaoC family dehydratase [Alphaproteobacteria bacterium]|jgi:acyl dehydratase|nr:MaoC family dehydratase [Alphaproteobacteria bacterium]MDP6566741.1 MaoC family dehydratase [Alphaproteobacteria bacterium]MDP6814705.1 MaoC family dehydratase [Alphaproteobacteria bacterium]